MIRNINGKSMAKFFNRQKTTLYEPFFYILWHEILKTAKGFGGMEKKCEF